MKKIILFVAFMSSFLTIHAQTFGNGNIKTETRNIENIRKVLIDINGKVEIICGSQESKIELTYDENILPFVSTKKKMGLLKISQSKWIEGTQEISIKIYTNEIDLLSNDSWSKIEVKDINQERMKIISTISNISLFGEVKTLKISSESSVINAYDLKAAEVEVKISEDGKAYVNATETLKVNCSEDGLVKYNSEPKNITGISSPGKEVEQPKKINTRFIDVKVKNNSLNIIHTYVKGPKPDGEYFSYGLSFGPMKIRSERWSIGTKLYKVNAFGLKKLLYEFTAEDEGQVVNLREKG